ncbi:MAG: DNA (cytosine-5-)-methyltransferase [Planctomycetota bacterium]|nr:DNA (cytosine-5-)-methyltransferase [Planctomycetota bacterium]
MPKDLHIRNVPDLVRTKIRREASRLPVSQNTYLLTVLSEAVESQKGPSLFDRISDELTGKDTPSQYNVNYSVPFTFVDLFSGIGGMRLGLEAVGGKCKFSCEVDPYAQKTYLAWFGENPAGDVTKLIDAQDIPPHDILAAGFPCQPFSLAGVSKKNSLGREHGFKDRTQGTLFFHLATIIELHRPPVVLLENVKNLRSHNKGDTWKTILGTLDDLDYEVFSEVIDASAWVPQHRERVLIVCFDRRVFGNSPPFEFPDPPSGPQPQLQEILEEAPDAKYTLTDHLWQYLQDYAERHRKKGNGFGCSVADLDGITRTLSARYYKDGSEVLIPRGEAKNPRRLTPREAGRLMGFPEHLLDKQVVSDTQAYKQFGNAVVPKVVEAVARQIVKVMQWHLVGKNGCLIKKQGRRL